MSRPVQSNAVKTILFLPLILSLGTWCVSHHRKIEIYSLFGPYCTQTLVIDGYIDHDAIGDGNWSRPWLKARLTGKMAGMCSLATPNTSYFTTNFERPQPRLVSWEARSNFIHIAILVALGCLLYDSIIGVG